MARYSSWYFLVGDNRPDLVSFGEKLLNYIDEQRKLSGVKSQYIKRILPDGSIVEAKFAYDIPMLRIQAVPGTGAVEYDETIGFVVFPRNDTYTGGLDATYPQEILKPLWKPYYYSNAIAALATLGSVGTYHEKFPDGIMHGGNQDWCGPTGVRLNWYGPSRRYWFDTYRTPGGQYGPFVFLNGSVLLDTTVFFADEPIDENYVLAAAERDGYLYVMQASIADFPTTFTIPDRLGWPSNRAGGFTAPYPDGDTSLALYRYRIVRNLAPIGNADLFSVEDAELLWTHTGRGWVNPWFFDPQVTVCESFAMPDELRAFRWESPSGTEDLNPSASSEHCILTIDADGTTITEAFDDRTVACGTFGSLTDCEIAADYAADGTRIPLVLSRGEYDYPSPAPPLTYVYSHTELKMGDGEPFVLSFLRTGPGPDTSLNNTGQGGELLAIDLRTQTLVLLRHVFEDTTALEVALYLNGQVVHQERLCDTFLATGWTNWLDNWNDNIGRYGDDDPTHPADDSMVSPLFKVCGIAGDFSYTSSSVTFSRYGVPAGVGRHWMLNPVSERRGALRLNKLATTTNLTMTADTSHFELDATDVHGYAVPASLAVDKHGRFIASVAAYFPYSDTSKGIFLSGWANAGALQYHTVNFITGGTLPVESGIDPTRARFGPVWQIGKNPQTS